MDDLVQWLGDQLDVDERIARAVTTEGAWRVGSSHGGASVEGEGWTVAGADALDGAHIAEHDPARVRREIAAKRRILARHTPHASGSTDCAERCGQTHPGVQVCNHDGYRWPCPDVRDLADCYAHRPGYKENWRP